uniref:GATOR complex protein NPRL3 n=1 Tax=Panagrellus redivivus TaxID=6233 RepID=A0A7E4UQU3_PANRE
MALLDTARCPDNPMGFVVTILDSLHSSPGHVLFVYPTRQQKLERSGSIEDIIDAININKKVEPLQRWTDETRFGITLEHFPLLLEPRDPNQTDLNVKVDATRLIGHWFKVDDSAPGANDSFVISIAFIISGNCTSHAVEAYTSLSQKVNGALKSLQKAVNFVRLQVAVVMKEHDRVEDLLSREEEDIPYIPSYTIFDKCLHDSEMLQSLKNIYENILSFGGSTFYFDRRVQLNISVVSKGLLYCTLVPKTVTAMRELVDAIQPFHTLLFVDDQRPAVEPNPMMISFLSHYSPERSFEEIRLLMNCSVNQILLFVRNLVNSMRAVIIFPICLSNTYAIGPESNMSLKELADFYDELFPEKRNILRSQSEKESSKLHFLTEVLTFITPTTTLEDYFINTARLLPRAANTETIIFLLKTGLIVQTHMHFLLIEPSPKWHKGKDCSFEVSKRILTLISKCTALSDKFKSHVHKICSNCLKNKVPEMELFVALSDFICLIPLFQKSEYLEKIIYDTRISRPSLDRVLLYFKPVLSTFEVPAKM